MSIIDSDSLDVESPDIDPGDFDLDCQACGFVFYAADNISDCGKYLVCPACGCCADSD
jgi:hypothetical protein